MNVSFVLKWHYDTTHEILVGRRHFDQPLNVRRSGLDRVLVNLRVSKAAAPMSQECTSSDRLGNTYDTTR